MFTAYFYARRIQKIEKETREHEKARQEAEAELQILKTQLEQANAPRRSHRRRRRNPR